MPSYGIGTIPAPNALSKVSALESLQKQGLRRHLSTREHKAATLHIHITNKNLAGALRQAWKECGSMELAVLRIIHLYDFAIDDLQEVLEF